MLRRIAVGLVLVVSLAPRASSAANGNKPRIPVLWSPSTCATVVDRSATPIVHLEYTVPEEDVPDMRTPDEVDDSRTQQFFAFGRLDFAAYASADKLTRWITQADIDRAAAVDPAVASLVASGIRADDILETTSRFPAGSWVRIIADDARVPISNAQAAMGIDWDVSAVAPGAYTLWGYTWEPQLNLWELRPGFVKVIASAAEADAAGPGIALDTENAQIVTGEAHPLSGCVDTAAGSTITLEWGLTQGGVEPEWQPAIEDEPIASGALAIDLVLPYEAAQAGTIVKLRATVTDPGGKSYTTYSPGSYQVMPGEAQDDGDEDGCGCAQGRGGLAGLAALAMLGLRRRRRAAL
ncbi:MAG: hypothetical protein IAG13_12495 [Deltaproteobacteria bacterium]|nr:hypothetical protein [Nannocystaceae bacterium]